MEDAIHNFPKQFDYQPIIEHARKLKKKKQFVVVGMGGSHLAADLIAEFDQTLPLVIRRDYGLPPIPEKELKKSLIIASSYSGNTEEVVSAYNEAKRRGLALAVIAAGGKLVSMAKRDKTPYIQFPNTGIQPRSALAFSVLAHLKMLGMEKELKGMKKLSTKLCSKTCEKVGKALAKKLKDKVPVIYTSRRNETVAWNWKIKFNETGKIPAFYNVFPELNHNEMTGFDVKPSSKHLSKPFHFIIIKDKQDHPRIQKRMDVVERLYKARKLPVTMLELTGNGVFEKVFNSLLIADWTAVHTANLYGLENELVPMVEEFKKMV